MYCLPPKSLYSSNNRYFTRKLHILKKNILTKVCKLLQWTTTTTTTTRTTYIHDDGSPEEKTFIDDVRKETDRRIPPDYAWVCSRPSITWICDRPSIQWIVSSLDMGGGVLKYGNFDDFGGGLIKHGILTYYKAGPPAFYYTPALYYTFGL